MRHLLLSTTALLAFAAAPANAQIISITGDGSSPPGFTSIVTPRYYGGFTINNGVITAFPTVPSYYPTPNPYYGYRANPVGYSISTFYPRSTGYPGYNNGYPAMMWWP